MKKVRGFSPGTNKFDRDKKRLKGLYNRIRSIRRKDKAVFQLLNIHLDLIKDLMDLSHNLDARVRMLEGVKSGKGLSRYLK